MIELTDRFDDLIRMAAVYPHEMQKFLTRLLRQGRQRVTKGK
jgi:hypothetical protein